MEYNKIINRQATDSRANSDLVKKRKVFNGLSIGDYYGGGLIFSKNSNNYVIKVMATSHSSKLSGYYEAKNKCTTLILNGYSDWYLPNEVEFSAIARNNKIINSKGANAPKFFSEIKSGRYWIDALSANSYMYGRTVIYSVLTDGTRSRYIPVRIINL